MIKFVILAVCALACLTQAKLSKEFATAPEIERQHALEQLQNFDYLGAVVKLVLKTPEQAVANVNEVLNKNINAKAEEVLNAFNAGLNARIFVINGDYIEMDRTAFAKMIFENTRSFARVFYPSVKQRSANSLYERKLQQYASAIEVRQPLEQFNAILKAEEPVAVKAASLSAIINSITSSIFSTIGGIVSLIAAIIANVLKAILTLNTNILDFLQKNISLLFTILGPIGQAINNILQRIIDVVSSLITTATSRKRRDVSEGVDVKAIEVVNTAGTILNSIAKGLVSIAKELGNDVILVLTTAAKLVFSAIAYVGTALNTLLSLGNDSTVKSLM